MRILVHDFAGHAFQVQLSRELAKRGHNVKHVYPQGLGGPKGPLRRLADDVDNLAINGVPLSATFRKYSALRRLQSHRRYASDLRALISDYDPELVLSGNTPIDVQAELLWHCRRKGIGFVHWVQDVYSKAVEFYFQKKLAGLAGSAGFLLHKLEAEVTKRSDGVVVIAPAFKTLLSSWGVPESKIATIQNWAPLTDITPLPRQNRWSEEHGLNSRTVFLYSGSLGLKHRPDLLYKLATELDENCTVVVITEGIGRDYLQELPNRSNLRLLPFQPYERVPEILATADVLLTTLEADAGEFAVPSKLLSYLCAARPVLIAAPCANLASQIVRESRAGMAVDPDDLEAWCEAAKQLAGDPEFRKRAGQNAAVYAERHFDIELISNAFETVFQRALHKRTMPSGMDVLITETEV